MAVKGNTPRIALIHAVYALAWAGAAAAAGLQSVAAGCILVLLAALVVCAILNLRRSSRGRRNDDPAVLATIMRINIATAVVGVLVVIACGMLRLDNWIPPAVLAVLAVHFLPLWRLLNRLSLLVMAVALALVAAAGGIVPAFTTCILAAGVFAVNSARLVLKTETAC